MDQRAILGSVWQPAVKCPTGQFVTGFRLKTADSDPADLEGATSIELSCRPWTAGTLPGASTILAYGTGRGTWSPWQTCPIDQLIGGAWVRMAAVVLKGDNTGASLAGGAD